MFFPPQHNSSISLILSGYSCYLQPESLYSRRWSFVPLTLYCSYHVQWCRSFPATHSRVQRQLYLVVWVKKYTTVQSSTYLDPSINDSTQTLTTKWQILAINDIRNDVRSSVVLHVCYFIYIFSALTHVVFLGCWWHHERDPNAHTLSYDTSIG